jgi:dihydropteroate synthase-like protein
VDPVGRPAVTRVTFVTGRLAEPALRRTLEELGPALEPHVAVMKITVAALMTVSWLKKFLVVPPGTDLVLLPGLVEGDPAELAAHLGVRVEKGPKDLRDLPVYFGRQARAPDYGAWTVHIVAEINNASKLSMAERIAMAERFAADGADYVDVGCTPGRAFPDLGETVRELVARGFRVSVDSFDPDEIRTAVAAGATLVLSVNGSNLEVAKPYAGTGVRVVVIPDFGQGMESLAANVAQLEAWGVDFWIDPIIEPIGYGFTASLERYAEVHRRWPQHRQMMGVGNLTELTAADTTGMHALLLAVAEETGCAAVLTTEVIPWARRAVKEIDVARRLMHYAVSKKALPKHVDDRLVTIKDPRPLRVAEAELRALQAQVTDPNFRIFADAEAITVFNHELFVRGTDIRRIFEQLGVDEPGHAFYLGKELQKAKLAMQLGKTYRQEGVLNWGYLTPEEDEVREHVDLTMRKRRGVRPTRADGDA